MPQWTKVLLAGFCLAVVATAQQTRDPFLDQVRNSSGRTESTMGNLAPIIRAIQQDTNFRLDYRHRNGMTLEQWRRRGREEVARALSFSPNAVPLDLRIESVIDRADYEIRRVSFQSTPFYRVPALLLVPRKGKPPYPGVVALHDHGGYFFHGKEKLVYLEGEHPALAAFRESNYGGRSYADELARRGFVVLVIDAFVWGERRLQYEHPPADLEAALKAVKPEQVEYVNLYNAFVLKRLCELNSVLAIAGTTWLGIMNYDDRRSVDVLASLPEVDPERIGCVGLSIGGYRATYPTGMDSRIRASVIAGWMTSLPTTLDIPYTVVAGLLDAASVHAALDHPDIATLAAPGCAVFVQNCLRDRLFTTAGMQASCEKIRDVYRDLGSPERFRSKFYDVPHQFNIEMQEAAFAWLERWLGPAKTTKQ